MSWYLKVLQEYATFSGRARRKEYWMFALFNILISVGLSLIDGALGTQTETGQGIISGIYSLGVLIPGIAVGVRRLHDTNRSGLWLLIAFVPCIGAILLLVYFATDGDSGSNQYGPDPKAGG
ncbi:MAG: DUF805 domain-containing protein [Planctomycetaceae bacterium]|nr:DUF805 domain-containing protein [Planctomycetaceae bacterium]